VQAYALSQSQSFLVTYSTDVRQRPNPLHPSHL
jgi:hypothetical protein